MYKKSTHLNYISYQMRIVKITMHLKLHYAHEFGNFPLFICISFDIVENEIETLDIYFVPIKPI